MHIVVGLTLILMCAAWMIAAVRYPGPVTLFMAVSSLFTIGYYGLPILLIERSTLRFLPEREITTTIGMSTLFFAMMSIGVAIVMRRRWGTNLQVRFMPFDALLERHWWPVTLISNLLVAHYLRTESQTVYQFENFEAFVASRSALTSIVAFLSGLLQAFTAINLVKALQRKSAIRIVVASAGMLVQLTLIATTAHRTMFTAPFLLVLGAMVMLRLNRMAGITLVVAVAALLAYSPFAVVLRSGSWNSSQDVVAQNFSYGDDAFDDIVQSIVDRGDILQSNSILKSYTDANGHLGWKYYYSVLAVPIPRFLYRGKPYILSDTGDMNGESSILAWHLSVSPTPGSLTAFGAIIAYREGGWIWLTINGLLTGALIAYLLTILSRGQLFAQSFYITAFFSWGVRKVPPSLMEVMVDVMTYLPLVAFLLIVGRILTGRNAEEVPSQASGAAQLKPAPWRAS